MSTTGVRDEPEPEEDDVAGHVGDEHVAEHQHADRVDDAGGERQQQQPATVIRSETGEATGMAGGCPYSCGVRSSDVTVDMRVMNHFASWRCIVNR